MEECLSDPGFEFETLRRSMSLGKFRKSYALWNPFTNMRGFGSQGVVFVEGQGILLKDQEGREYINGMASLWNVNCGLGRQEIIDAVTEQMKKMAFVSNFRMANEPAILLAEKLVQITPPSLSKVFFTNSGSCAVETAIKVVRNYSKLKGGKNKYKIIALEGGYHGVSMGAMNASGVEEMKSPFGPSLPGFIHIAPPYCYRCALRLEYPSCDLACASELEKKILAEGPDSVGAFIMEPVMGYGGCIIPPDEYFDRVQTICARYGVFLILDEITTGFGRLGHWFAADRWDIRPDLMVLAKGINSGYLPLGACLICQKVYDRFLKGEGIVFEHGSTTDGHPVCCASALANIDILEREHLIDNARDVGRYLLEQCNDLYAFSFVGDVRGMGLMVGIELVEDRKTKRRLKDDQVFLIAARLFKSGLLVYHMKNRIMLFPPLIFSMSDVDTTVSTIKRTFEKISRLIH